MLGIDKTRRTLVTFAAVAAVGLGLAHTDTARAAVKEITSVLVTNDAAHPIPVQVTQAPLPPRVSTDDNLEPVILRISDGGAVYGNDWQPFVVPAGKRLVVEAVHWRIFSWPQVHQANVLFGDTIFPLPIQTDLQDAQGVHAAVIGGPVRLYVEPGQTLRLTFHFVAPDERYASSSGVVVGHYVNAL